MAIVPIVTEVTKAQLDALVAANGLDEGLQYKITDKNWLLVATGVNTLNPLNGILRIANGQDITGITADVLFIDTGLIDYSDSVNPIITIPTGFVTDSVYLESHSVGDGFTILNLNEDLLFQCNSTYDGYKAVFKGQYEVNIQVYIPFYDGNIAITGTNSSTNSARFIFKAIKYV